MADLKLSAVITVADKASGPLREINRNLARTQAPVQRLARQFKTLDRTSGLKGMRSAMDGLARSAGVLSLKLGGLAAGGFLLLKNTVIDTGAQFETYEAILTSIEGSSEKAQASMAWVSNFATTTPLQLDGVMDAFVKLRAFGLDPMNGTLQALVDQNSKLGGSQEKLEGIILAVGQAWTKGKLQGEEALQLIERGVPVWDLLSKATGRSALELQKMSSKGKLGRDAIKLLLEGIGRSAAGASAEQMKTFSGLVANLSDQWLRFQKMVADAGIFDLIKKKIKGVLDSVNAMAESGKLEEWAKKISDSLVKIVNEIPDIVKGIAEFATEASDFVGGPGNLLKGALVGLAALMVGPMAAAIVTLSAVILTTPVGWLLGGIALIAGGAAVLIAKWGEFPTSWADVWDRVKDIASSAIKFLFVTMNPLLNLVDLIDKALGGAVSKQGAVAEKIAKIPGFASSESAGEQRKDIVGGRNRSNANTQSIIGGGNRRDRLDVNLTLKGNQQVEKSIVKTTNSGVRINIDAGPNLAAAG